MRMAIAIAMAVLTGLPALAQNTIKRKGTTTKPTTRRMSAPEIKKAVKKRAARMAGHSVLPDVDEDLVAVDSVAADDEPLSNEPVELTMSSGYMLYGRVKSEFVDNAEAQKTIRERLSKCDNAKTACLTDHAGIFVFGGNGYSSNGLSNDITEALHYCNKNKHTINDIAVTDVGWWCLIYDGNKYKGNLPAACKKSLDKYLSDGEKILSVSISENGNYALVTDKHYEASNDIDQRMLKNAVERFGHISAVSITNAGIIVTCQRGAYFWDVPHNIIELLQKQEGTPTVVRFTDSGTYVALNGSGFRAWHM